MRPFPPTRRQLDLLRFVRGFQLAHGFGPSVQEIAAGLGFRNASKSAAVRLVVGCEERGLLRRLPSRARSIELVDPPAIPFAPDGAPLFFVPAGEAN